MERLQLLFKIQSFRFIVNHPRPTIQERDNASQVLLVTFMRHGFAALAVYQPEFLQNLSTPSGFSVLQLLNAVELELYLHICFLQLLIGNIFLAYLTIPIVLEILHSRGI